MFRVSTKCRLFFACGSSVLALLATPAIANSDASTFEAEASEAAEDSSYVSSGPEITVTARRREESAQDVPIALSVISADVLDKTGFVSLNQIQQLVPSIQSSGSNPRGTSVTIRGLGSNAGFSIDGLENGVGFYIDGVYYARPGQTQFDMVDIERFEVLRGPQGTLFGKNTTAGAINITTRAPSFTPELNAEAHIGNYGYHQVRASASLPLVDDAVALRLSFADTHRDGFATNRYDGRKLDDTESLIARAQLLIKPSSPLSIRLIGDYSKWVSHTSPSINTVEGYFTHYANGAPIANNFVDRANRTGYELLASDPYSGIVAANGDIEAKMESYGVSGEVNWDLGPVTLTSVTAYRGWDWDPTNDTDGTSLSLFTKSGVSNAQRQFSQEFRVASNGTNTIDYVAGLYYFWQRVEGTQVQGYGSDFAAWNSNPATTTTARLNAINIAANGFDVLSFADPKTKSYAAFAQADWKITDKLTLTAGLRFSHEKKHGSFRQWQDASGAVDVATLDAALAAEVTAIRNGYGRVFGYSAKDNASALTGQATLAYKVTPEVLLYGSYARGNKSGGLNLAAGGLLNPVVDAETVDSFELGVKSSLLDRRLTLNIAAFHTDVSDYQASISERDLETQALSQYISNIPKVRSKGIEVDATFAPSRWVQFTASAAYTDAKYVTYTNAPQAVPERANELSAIQDISGTYIPGIPKFAYSVSADVAQPFKGGAVEAYAHADYFHRSFYETASVYSILPSYGVANARIGVRSSDGQLDVSLWARNLLDSKYLISRSGNNTGVINVRTGDPRTWGLTLRTKF